VLRTARNLNSVANIFRLQFNPNINIENEFDNRTTVIMSEEPEVRSNEKEGRTRSCSDAKTSRSKEMNI
tara:strand:+ start:16359 stop:16565 length:207 start_codon:yes stop_codon:yes gene_type:complete